MIKPALDFRRRNINIISGTCHTGIIRSSDSTHPTKNDIYNHIIRTHFFVTVCIRSLVAGCFFDITVLYHTFICIERNKIDLFKW